MEKKSAMMVYKIVQGQKVMALKKQQEFLVELIAGIIKSRLVIFLKIADIITRSIKVHL